MIRWLVYKLPLTNQTYLYEDTSHEDWFMDYCQPSNMLA